jgi:16S rRNA (cytidine1402-2'-O)-methyltransferase
MKEGKLYICPTPIGNLEDITFRVLNTLKEVDLIAAEDTRHTIKLLNHYGIKKPLTSYHEHNVREKGPELIDRLKAGESIALVSDAGMPGISDPGEDLIKLAIEEGIEVIALPGPTASITALVVSGLPTDKFVFEGFLSSKRKQRKEELSSLKEEKRTIIIYESPYRVLETLDDILDVLGNRNIALVRELTKVYEEVFRGTIQEAIEKFSKDKIRGEFCLILEGCKVEEEADIDIEKELRRYLEKGFSKKESVKKVVKEFNLPKNLVYHKSLEIDK